MKPINTTITTLRTNKVPQYITAATYVQERVNVAADVVLGGAHEGGALQQRGAGVRLAQDGVHCNNNGAVVSVSEKNRIQ